jgi:hypothetical protein
MSSRTRFKCLHCRELQYCEPRSRGRQRYCAKPGCRKASKAASQRRWLGKAENVDYFRGNANVERVRRWRAAHPGYWRKGEAPQQDALQETCMEQVIVAEQDAVQKAAPALQDAFRAQHALLVGLIAALTGHALQEDIAASARMFQSRGEDILRMGRWVSPDADHENQTDFVRATTAARTAPV